MLERLNGGVGKAGHNLPYMILTACAVFNRTFGLVLRVDKKNHEDDKNV